MTEMQGDWRREQPRIGAHTSSAPLACSSRRLIASILGFLGLQLTLSAAAADEGARSAALSWIRTPGAESCTAGPELATELEQYLGRPVLVALSRAELSVEGAISAAADGFEAHLALIEPSGVVRGERTVAAKTVECKKLDPLLVFVIALLIDPDAPLLPPALPEGLSLSTEHMLAELFATEPSIPPLELAAPAPAGTAVTEVGEVSAQSAPEERGRSPSAQWAFGLQLDALGMRGMMPAIAFSGRLLLRAMLRNAWRFGLGGSLSMDSALPGNRASFSLLQGELVVCPRLFRTAAVAVWGCIDVASGAMSTRVNATDPRNPVRFTAQLGLGPELSWSVGERIALQVGLGAQVPLVRDNYYWNDALGRQRVFRMSPLVGIGYLGASARIF
jgi:hypothetical protein